MIAYFIIPLVFFCLYNTLFVILSGKTFGKCIPLSMMTMVFVLYISQFCFNSFKPGVVILYILAGLAIPCLVLFKKKYEYKKMIFSAGFISFVCIYVVYNIIDYHRTFTTFDEWYHWGMMVKEMLRLDSFYSVAESHLHIHKDYPPFISIFEFFFCKLSGGYSEGRVSAAIHIFTLSLIAPAFSELICENKKETVLSRFIKCISAVFIILSVMLFFDPWWARISSTILVDVLEGVIFAYSFLLVWFAKENEKDIFRLICLIVANASMIMIKEVGLGLCMVVAACFVLRIITEREGIILKSRLQSVFALLLSVIIPISNYVIWKLYVKKLGIIGQFDLGSLDFKVYLNTLLGRNPGLQKDTLYSFFCALFSTKINQVSFIPMTYVSAFIMMLLLLLIIRLRFKKEFSSAKIVNLLISFTCGTLGYAFMMSVLYIFCFNPSEMSQLASYNRYMATYVLGEMLALGIIIVISADRIKGFFEDAGKIIIIMALALLINTENLLYIAPQAIRGDVHTKYEEYAAKLASYADPGARVFVIYDKSQSDQVWYGPMQIYLAYYDNDLSIDYNNNDAYELDYSDENTRTSILTEINKNDYLYIIDVNDNVESLLSDKVDSLESNSVYKIYEDGFYYKLD